MVRHKVRSAYRQVMTPCIVADVTPNFHPGITRVRG
jgi:hypothetical protein